MTRVYGIDTGLREVTIVVLDCARGKRPRYVDAAQASYAGPLRSEAQCLAAYRFMLREARVLAGQWRAGTGAAAEHGSVEMYGWQGGARAMGTVHVGPQLGRMAGALEECLGIEALTRNEVMARLGCRGTKELNRMMKTVLGELDTEHHYAAAAVAWAAFLGMKV